MITNKELLIQNESYTKKDFYQIYPEILDLVKKITNRWDPSSSNESDPGVVLLKLLAFIADKTNYNIDKNILECFMSSVSQEDNMKKLCDMMGYDMHYYKSAFTTISLMWKGEELDEEYETSPTKSITIPRFTTISDDSKDISFITTSDVNLIYRYEVKDVDVLEGEIVDFKINDDNYISIYNLDSRNRLYFPESQIAENGIWVYQPDLNKQDSGVTNTNTWEQVSNLNTQNINKKVYKFGYDSSRRLPYLQFAENVSEYFGKGIKIKYVRTKGADGNISAKTLSIVSSGQVYFSDTSKGELDTPIQTQDEEGNEYLVIENASATTNGYNPETLDEAYEGFKRTIGTFDTLVTCRDYANKIYNMIQSDRDNTYLVSNCQVSDIRDDINTAQTIVTLNEYGTVFEKQVSKEAVNVNRIDGDKGVVKINKDRVSNFDLFIYPLNPINNSSSQETYRNCFKPNYDNIYNIKSQLDDYKTLSHNIRQFNVNSSEFNDIYLLKNYYNLSAKITTTSKVTTYEASQIKANIYKNLFKNFNARKLEYGEEIPYDSLLKCIQEADSRIKMVSLNEPEIETYYMYPDGTEYKLDPKTKEYNNDSEGKIYNKLLVKNILAGKIPLFNFDNRIKYSLGDKITDTETSLIGGERKYSNGTSLDAATKKSNSITHITSSLKFTKNKKYENYILNPNQMLQLISPSLHTIKSYPVYVNYHLDLANAQIGEAIACHLTPITEENLSVAVNKKLTEGKTVFRRSKHPDGSAVKGYLVDEDLYKYKEIDQFVENHLYYTQEEGDTLGVNASYKYIPKDSEYKLSGSDILYINYSDSDDTQHWIKYLGDGSIIENGITILDGNETPNLNIIKPNFDLYHSASLNKSYSKTGEKLYDSGWVKKNDGDDNTDLLDAKEFGLYSLGTSEQIDLRAFVKTKLNQPRSCYWITNHNNNLVLNLVNDDRTNKIATYEYVLDEGEYFFYTNNTKTNLVTFGSGTKLKCTEKYVTSSSLVKKFQIKLSEIINVEDIADKGIGAFNDVNWQLIQFSDDNYLEIQEMNILTLTEGDIVNFELKNVQDLDYNWIKIDSSNFKDIASEQNKEVYFKYNGKELPVGSIENLFYWEIRSLLNINLGPELTQELKNYNNNSIQEKFYLYTSTLTIDNKVIENPTKSDLQHAESILEEVFTNEPLQEFSASERDRCVLKSSKLIQAIGGKLVSTHRVEIDGTRVDDLYIYKYNPTNIKTFKQDSTGNTETEVKFSNDLLSLSFNNIDSLETYIPCLLDTYAYLTIYYSPGLELSNNNGAYIVLSIDDGMPLLPATRILNSSNAKLEVNFENQTSTYYLKEGLNIIYTNGP